MKTDFFKKKEKTSFSSLSNNRGQSTAEYVIVVSLLLTVLIGSDNVKDTLVKTFHNKYQSYAFGVSISDPPSSAFDKEVNDDAKKIKEITDIIKDLIDFVTGADPHAGDEGKNPVTEDLEEFERRIKNL